MARKATKKITAKKSKKAPVSPNKGFDPKESLVNYSQIIKSGYSQLRSKRYFPLMIVALALLIILAVVPHLVVAMVDGRPITIFSYYGTLDQKYGKDTKDQLISDQLIMDEAAKRGVSVSDTEVNDQIKKVEDQASGSANLDQVLAQQGLTRNEFRKQVYLQSLIQKMFARESTVSSQEVDNYLNTNKDQLGAITDQTRTQAETQLKQQKLVSAFQSWLQSAQNSSRVSKF